LEPGNNLLISRKGHNPLTPQSVSRLVSNWFLGAGLSGLKGVKSLRKTWEVYYKDHFGNEASSDRASSTTGTIGVLNAYTLSDQVENRLIELILTGQIPPGRRLILKEIANEMGISPMPVRDALTRLVAGGIVHLEKNRGYEANTITELEFREIAELRSILEPIAAVSGCHHATKEDLEKLMVFAGDFKKALQNDSPQTALRFNHDFHFGLYNLSRRPILIQFLNKLWDMTSPYHHLLSKELMPFSLNQIKHGEYYHDAFLHHEKIIEALENKNEKELSKWIKADIDSSAKKFLSDFYNNRQ
jgi:DNA-binding GntR family transcriptional regulator